jgi:hypothetical protein
MHRISLDDLGNRSFGSDSVSRACGSSLANENLLADCSLATDWDDEMKFPLQYRGPLLSAQSSKGNARRKEQQDIRRALHPQLLRRWLEHRRLLPLAEQNFAQLRWNQGTLRRVEIRPDGRTIPIEPDWAIVSRTSPDGKQVDYLPLVVRTPQNSLLCELDIHIFWREKQRGGVFKAGSEGFDLDNRLSVLLDALSVPQHDNQLPTGDDDSPSPLLCLLANDNLIKRINIEADPHGLPPSSQQERDASYVEVNIRVTISGGDLSDGLDDESI